MLGLGLGVNRGGFVPSIPLLLDTYTGAAAAYSLRKLRTAYTGAAIRVRESATNTEADIGFNADGTLNTTALLAHVGANNGFVVTWYDQSGNARNATQSTVLEQPQIVASGSVILENSKPTLKFDGVDDFLLNGVINISQPITSFWTAKANPKATAVFFDSNVTNRFAHAVTSAGANFTISYDNAGAVIPITYNANYNLFYALASSTSEFAINGQSAVTGSIGSNGLSSLRIGDIRSTITGINFHLDGNINEVIIYPSDQSANRTAIESNINAYYNIY